MKIESEEKIEKREEKKSDGVVAEVQNVATEVAKEKEIKEKDCDGEEGEGGWKQ